MRFRFSFLLASLAFGASSVTAFAAGNEDTCPVTTTPSFFPPPPSPPPFLPSLSLLHLPSFLPSPAPSSFLPYTHSFYHSFHSHTHTHTFISVVSTFILPHTRCSCLFLIPSYYHSFSSPFHSFISLSLSLSPGSCSAVHTAVRLPPTPRELRQLSVGNA